MEIRFSTRVHPYVHLEILPVPIRSFSYTKKYFVHLEILPVPIRSFSYTKKYRSWKNCRCIFRRLRETRTSLMVPCKLKNRVPSLVIANLSKLLSHSLWVTANELQSMTKAYTRYACLSLSMTWSLKLMDHNIFNMNYESKPMSHSWGCSCTKPLVF